MCVDDATSRYRDDDHIARVKQVAGGHGLTAWSVHAPFWETDISALDEARRRQAAENVVRAMEVAQALGAGIVVVHGSKEPVEDPERKDRLIACVRSINELCKRASQRGLLVALETLPRSCLGNRVAEVQWLLGIVDADLRVCYDVNHVTLYEDVRESLRALGDRIVTVHISDHDGVDERHWIPGRGVVDWEGFVAGLREIGYWGCLMHEAVDRDADLETNLGLIVEAARERFA
jgi:sugar phosphate isomerase/epimerase